MASIVSRRALTLSQKHAKQSGKAPTSNPKSSSNTATKETPWPKSLRYTFYGVCAVSVPLSVAQAISMSPCLRNYLEGDDVESEGSDSASASNKLVHMVRQYWGNVDYIAPVDQRSANHVVPGYRLESQEDNWSSLLAFLGLHTPSSEEQSTAKEEMATPVSFEHEPNTDARHEQTSIMQYLSPQHNPSGVNTHLSLIPCESDKATENSGHEFDYNLPANASLSTLRKSSRVYNASSAKQVLEVTFPGKDFGVGLQSNIQSMSWNGGYRWVLDFGAYDRIDKAVGNGNAFTVEGFVDSVESGDDNQSQSNEAAKMLLHSTAVNSAWSLFQSAESNSSEGNTASASTTSSSPSSSTFITKPTTSAPATSTPSYSSGDNIRMQKLVYEIANLEKDLKDPSSMRDRDAMYEELKEARRELNSLKPSWWRRMRG
eukprot:scaffold3010_cov198-Alexandrium_tamarense.AAC.20